ncbi:MAG: LuxR family transcriptional regulator [Rhodospirillales bacterium]|nr:LuxR family transcriptional regulator [Rhodospirillales bacterium]MCB9994885.1 LuxR family transcriptional regulator [Rhodospirillales bacterium]
MNLIEFIEVSNRAQNIEELTANFLAFLNGFGMERFIMGEISHDSTEKKEKYLGVLVNYPEEWLNHYVTNHYVDYDPVYQAALTARRPYTWSEVQERNISEKAQKVMNEAKEAKLYSGIGLSIHQPMGEIIGMGFAGSEKDARCDRDAVSMIYAAANQFFTVYSDFIMDDPTEIAVNLTARENETLLWLARGKTKAEISDILLISESTVKRHCENIFSKLQVNNIPFAVLKAVRMGLIKPF